MHGATSPSYDHARASSPYSPCVPLYVWMSFHVGPPREMDCLNLMGTLGRIHATPQRSHFACGRLGVRNRTPCASGRSSLGTMVLNTNQHTHPPRVRLVNGDAVICSTACASLNRRAAKGKTPKARLARVQPTNMQSAGIIAAGNSNCTMPALLKER